MDVPHADVLHAILQTSCMLQTCRRAERASPRARAQEAATGPERSGPRGPYDSQPSGRTQEVDIGQVFLGLEEGQFAYALHSMVWNPNPSGRAQEVDIGQVFLGLEEGQVAYALHSMVCFYGAHYFVFVWSAAAAAWLLFDDAHVSRVGGWDAVTRKCFLGRIQPSVLFFTRAGPA